VAVSGEQLTRSWVAGYIQHPSIRTNCLLLAAHCSLFYED